MSIERPHNASATTGRDNIAAIVQMMLRENAVVAPNFFNVSQFAEPGDRSVSFPLTSNNFNVQKLGVSDKGDDQEIVYALEKLELDQDAHIQWLIKKFDQAKSRVPILRTAIENATRSHAIDLDQTILDEVLAGLTTTPVTGGIDQDAIVDAITTLNTEYAPADGRFWLVGTTGYGTLLKIAGFIDASKSNMNIVMNGQIGQLYGYPVIMSNVYPATEMGLFHNQAIAYGFAANPEIEDAKAIEYGTGSRRWVMDQNYGVKTLNGGKLGVKITA